MKKLVAACLFSLSMTAVACGGGGDKIGVAECDTFIEKLDKCASTIGGAEGDSLKGMKKMLVPDWKKSAADPKQKDMLASTCKSALEDMKKAKAKCADL